MFTANSIRNVCLLGHSGSGKSALAESLLYMTGAIDRIGKNADGNTVSDYDPEEIRRNISISTSLIPLTYKNMKINLLDTPGGFDFSGAVMEALRAADAAVIVCSAKDGITVGFEKAWKYCEERNMPCFIYISKVDEENADYNVTFNALRERYGNRIAPVVVPIWDDNHKVTGIIDVLNKRAFEMQNLKRVEIPVPEGKESVITEFNDALKESVAETSDEFMDKFFGGEDFTYAEMIKGLHTGVVTRTLFPVLCGSGVTCLGSLMLMDHILDLFPNPVEGNYHKATTADGKTEEFVVSPGGVPAAYVFKTVSDQYGKYSYIKVLSGTITGDTTLVNARTGETEKLGRLYTMCGKKATEVKELSCGDIGAIGMPPPLAADRFTLDRVAVRPQPPAQLIYHCHRLQKQQMRAVRRPWGGLQNLCDRLPAHAGDADRIAFLGTDGIQPGRQPQGQQNTMLLRVARRMCKRPLANIRADRGRNAPFQQQRQRQFAVIRADIGQPRPLRHQCSHAGQPRR